MDEHFSTVDQTLLQSTNSVRAKQTCSHCVTYDREDREPCKFFFFYVTFLLCTSARQKILQEKNNGTKLRGASNKTEQSEQNESQCITSTEILNEDKAYPACN